MRRAPGGDANARPQARVPVPLLGTDDAYNDKGRFVSGSDIFTGTLELLILRTLREGDLHGYRIAKHIRETSRGVLDVEEGALYPALHRMERKGLVQSSWGRTDTNRRAKFYSLTPAGSDKLVTDAQRWSHFSDAVDTVLGPVEG